MVHSSLDRLAVVDDGARLPTGQTALWLLALLREVVGPEGTLCMPTHPWHRDNPGFMFDKSELVLPYSVRKTPSSVGVLTELFRRSVGTLRSRHPLSSLAANGPRARQLLENNLNGREPLPHGRDSGYHRFCELGGRVVSVGIGLLKVLTVLHVAEEVRDETWPVAGFFYRRHFDVEDETGQRARVTVRERRPEFVRALPLRRVRRDLRAEGILVEGEMAGIPIDVVDAKALLEFMREKQRSSPYPYLLPDLARRGKAPRPAPRAPVTRTA
jgi:aminoglycoside 3-N-acetyltransferase